MNPIDTLLAIRAAGGIVTVENDRLVVDIDHDLPPAVWDAVAQHRDEIVRLVAPDSVEGSKRSPEDILADVRDAGGNVTSAGDRLALDLPADIDDQLLDELDRSRDDILAHLQRTEWEDPFPNHDRHDLPADGIRCDRCGAAETVTVVIHGGASVRQDCARCGRFRKFTTWYGVEMP